MPVFSPNFDRVQWYIDNHFVKNEYRLVDKYVIRDGKKHPFAVICPGGGYGGVCSFVEGVPFARKLKKMGISAFILYYRVREQAKFPAPMDDLAHAVKEIFASAEKYHLDTRCYSVWGSSAGGHLAGSFGTQSIGYRKYGLPKPGLIVLVYPVVSMRRDVTHLGTHDTLLGADAEADSEASTSIDELVTPDYPPVYVFCGKNDETVPPENSVRLASALEQAGVAHQFRLFENAPHGCGLGIGTDAQGWLEEAVKFWKTLDETDAGGNKL